MKEKVLHQEKNVAERPPYGENVAKRPPYSSEKNYWFLGGRGAYSCSPCGCPCRVTNTTIYGFDACLSFTDLHNILLKNYPS